MAGRDRFVNEITVADDYEVPVDMDYVHVDATAGNIVITLKRTRDRLQRCHKVNKVDAGANTVTITDGTLSYVLLTEGEAAICEIGVDGLFTVYGAVLGRLVSTDGSVVITPSAGTFDLSAADAGVPESSAHNTLILAADVASAETVTIGADVYEIEIVNTDSTDNTQGGDFVPLTDPLVVVDAVTNYPNVFALAVGDLIRIGTEIMRITVKGAADMTFQRGVSGTTNATHANAADIFIGNSIAGSSTVAVGLVTTLTPAAFRAALVDDINSEGTEAFTASASVNNVVITADTPGSASNGVATTETLAGAGNHWEALETFGGADAGQQPLIYRALLLENATDAPEASILENTLGLLVWSYSAAGVYVGTLVGAFAGLVSLHVGSGIPSAAGQYTVVTLTRTNDDTVSLQTWDVTAASGIAALADDLLAGTYVEIIAWS